MRLKRLVPSALVVGTDAAATPQPGKDTIFPYRPRGFVEFDVTDAVRNWGSEVPNNGLLIRATNELIDGRDIRFASNASPDSDKHAFILVRCVTLQEMLYPLDHGEVVKSSPNP